MSSARPPADPHLARVRDRMTRRVLTLSPEQSVPLAQALMSLEHIRHIPVVDDGGRLVGLVSHRDILGACLSTLMPLTAEERSSVELRIPVARIMKTEVRTIEPDAPILTAARLMQEHRIGCLPVVEAGELVGIVTESDLLELLGRALEVGPTPGPWTVEHAMTAAPITIDRETTLGDARELMLRRGVRHLPVVDQGRPVAVVSEADLRLAEVVYREAGATTRASIAAYFCGQERLYTVEATARLEDVLLELWQRRLDAALVLRDGKLAGILTTADVCRLFGEHLRAQRASAG